MPSSIYLTVSAAALASLTQLASAQTNITASACIAESVYSDCNSKVADDWRSCINNCSGNGDCVVNCGCTAHQEYINCMAHSCWNQVYSCEYQLFIQQYFAVCPSATEPIPFWPAPDNAPNRCSCSLGKVLSNTLSARNAQISCAENITNAALNNIPDLSNLGNLGNIPNIARTATDCACCGASASISAAWQICPNTIPTLAGADLWPLFFPSALPNLYTSIPNFAWATCDDTLSATDCAKLGFTDADNKFYKPGDLPKNGTSTLHNVGGTVTAPPGGAVITWSQGQAMWTITATGVERGVVASVTGGGGSGSATGTGTGTGALATQTSNAAVGSVGVGVKGVGGLIGLVVGGFLAM